MDTLVEFIFEGSEWTNDWAIENFWNPSGFYESLCVRH